MNKLFRLRRSEYFRNIFIVASGTTVAQLIPIFFTPITARIFTPHHYGILGMYMSITTLAGTLATLNYANAIVVPKEDDEARKLVKISLGNCHVLFGIYLIAVLGFQLLAAIYGFGNAVGAWIFVAPFSVLMTGYMTTFTAYANRKKEYKLLSGNRVMAGLIQLPVSLGLGILLKTETGLILGYISGQFVNGIILGLKVIRRTGLGAADLTGFDGTKEIYRKYSSFPRYNLFADFINMFTNQVPVLFLNSFAGPAIVGWFNMSNRLLSLPITFIASAIGEVFKQRASEDIARSGNCSPIFKKTFKSLLLVSILPFITLLLFGPDIFAFFLGENWREAGHFSRLMAPVFLLRFVNSPMSYIVFLVNKLKFNLIATIYLSITTLLIFLTLNFLSLYETIALYSLNYSLIYCFMLYKNYTFSQLKLN